MFNYLNQNAILAASGEQKANYNIWGKCPNFCRQFFHSIDTGFEFSFFVSTTMFSNKNQVKSRIFANFETSS
jgi:hypothetical protein